MRENVVQGDGEREKETVAPHEGKSRCKRTWCGAMEGGKRSLSPRMKEKAGTKKRKRGDGTYKEASVAPRGQKFHPAMIQAG